MIELYEHNEIAYNKVVEMFKSVNKTSVIHPTGTGKTYIAFKLCEENQEKKICWLSPSNYIFQTQMESLKKDNIVIKNVEFFTYTKLTYISDYEFDNIKVDYIILDEFHRCGADIWGEKVLELLDNNREAKVLGLSATHIRYLDNQRNMANEIFAGNVSSEITLGEAIVRGILPTPKYITAIYEKSLEKYEKKIKRKNNTAIVDKSEKYLDDLKRALSEAEGLPRIFCKYMKKGEKYIVFCLDKEHLYAMISKSKEWFNDIDKNFKVYIVYSKGIESEEAFDKFKKDDSDNLKLIFCIDMLNEGVHIDDITGVILLRPTISPILYKQQIGRALSTSSKKEPIIFDIVNNFENLYLVTSIKDEMYKAINVFTKNGEKDKIISEKFNIYEQLPNAVELFQNLQESLSANFDTMYELAKEYYELNGNLRIPTRYKTSEGYALGGFIARQRLIRKGTEIGNLTDERIKKLDEIGMIWDYLKEPTSEKNLRLCEEYYKINGDLLVKYNHITECGVSLGQFVAKMRVKKNNLSKETIERLDKIEMVWSIGNHIFEDRYKRCEKFYNKNGHLDIVDTYKDEDGVAIGAWIKVQRKKYRENKLSKYEIANLNQIDMIWGKKTNIIWENGYKKAKEYYKINGHLNINPKYITENGYNLGNWIKNQRIKGKSELEDWKVQKLDSINFDWEIKKSRRSQTWDDIYELALLFYKDNKHLDIPTNFIKDDVKLNKWLSLQKKMYRNNDTKLTKEQIKLLEDIDIDWLTKKERIWENRYLEAEQFYKANGSSDDITEFDINLKSLKTWIKKQEKNITNSKISNDLIYRLNKIGITAKD